MIADRAPPTPARRVMFVKEVEQLPLLDPTAAARLLKVQRHTLACYRSLDTGPAYYKFGRWIRYSWEDLHLWTGATVGSFARPFGGVSSDDGLLLVDTPTAARFLTITRFCLSNYRLENGGPPFHRFGRRLYYGLSELRIWAERQRCLPGVPARTAQRG